MVENFVDSIKDKQRIKDQLGERDTYDLAISAWKVEKINVYTSKIIVASRDLGSAFILGHSERGILGSTTCLMGSSNLGATTWTTAASVSVNQRITDDGKNAIVNWLYGSTILHFDNISVGGGTTGFSITDTVLYDEKDRRLSFNTNIAGSSTGPIWSVFMDSTTSFCEVGLHNATTTGVMFTRGELDSTITMVKANAYRVKFDFEVDDA